MYVKHNANIFWEEPMEYFAHHADNITFVAVLEGVDFKIFESISIVRD